jgi:murein DD-endopeptidase MepM/ murein hydrolase activator NlpD
MNVIIFSKRDGRARQLDLHPIVLTGIIVAVLAVIGGAFGAGLSLGHDGSASALPFAQTARWSQVLAKQREQIADLRQQVQARTEAIAIQLGDMKAHVIRLDALGQRLTAMAGIKSSEFNFGQDPPQGGPESDIPGARPQIADISSMLKSLQSQIDLSGSQLSALENVILSRQLGQEIHPEGRPVNTGYISSPFGERVDPFTGGEAGWHTDPCRGGGHRDLGRTARRLRQHGADRPWQRLCDALRACREGTRARRRDGQPGRCDRAGG